MLYHFKAMDSKRDFVREAVLASMRVEKNLRNTSSYSAVAVDDDAKRRKALRRKGIHNDQKTGGNWKELQKTLSTSTAPKTQKIRKSRRVPLEKLVKSARNPAQEKFSSFMKRQVHRTENVTRVVAIDCEMVGVGRNGKRNALARVSVVNYSGDVLYDNFVRVHEIIADYRTQWSGIRPADVSPQSDRAVEPYEAQRTVGEILKGRIVVGHAIKNDLRAMQISHPWRDIRDTADFYKRLWNSQGHRGRRAPALKVLVAQVLGVDSFQKEEHDSCEDARAALELYKRNAKEWERSLQLKTRSRKTRKAITPSVVRGHEEN